MVKIERSMPAPKSLFTEKAKANGSYEKTDVVEQLRKDFHNKCYICEIDNLQDPQVEHLRPHFNGKNKDLKFDWNNLFWSCGHCNGVKNQRKCRKIHRLFRIRFHKIGEVDSSHLATTFDSVRLSTYYKMLLSGRFLIKAFLFGREAVYGEDFILRTNLCTMDHHGHAPCSVDDNFRIHT